MPSKASTVTTAIEVANDSDIQPIDIPEPLSQPESKVPDAMERLSGVSDEIMSGIPEEVRSATALPASKDERLDIMGTWRPAMYFIDSWNLHGAVARSFPTVETAHSTGMLPIEDYEVLTAAYARFEAAAGNFSEEIPDEVTQEVRRAIGNVNRGISGETLITREMVLAEAEQRRAARATEVEQKRRPTPPRRQQTEPKGRGQRNQRRSADPMKLLRDLDEAMKEFSWNPTNANFRSAMHTLRPFEGSEGYNQLKEYLKEKLGS